jgi:hypothetical protein
MLACARACIGCRLEARLLAADARRAELEAVVGSVLDDALQRVAAQQGLPPDLATELASLQAAAARLDGRCAQLQAQLAAQAGRYIC